VIFGQLPDNRAGRYLARVSRIDADDGGVVGFAFAAAESARIAAMMAGNV